MDIKRLVTDGAWAFLGRVGALALALAANVLLARMLSPSDFGAFFLVLSLAKVAALVGQVGMNQAVVRFVAGGLASGRTGQARDAAIKSLFITLIGSSLVGFLYLVAGSFLAGTVFRLPLMLTVGVFVCIWIVATAIRSLVAESFRGFSDLRLASLFELFISEFFLALMIVLAWFAGITLDFRAAVVLSTWAAGLSVLPALLLLRRKVVCLPRRSEIPVAELLRTGLPLLVSNLFVVVMSQAGFWIVGWGGSPSDLALYGAAFRSVMLLQLPLIILNSVAPQMISELHVQEKSGELERMLRSFALATVVPTGLAYGVLCLWGEQLLSLVFGPFYAGSYWMLLFLGAGVMVNAWVGFCGPALMMTGNQTALMRISLLCGLVTLSLAVPLGRYYGPEGVAAVMAAGSAGQHILMTWMVRRRLGIWTVAGNLAGLARRVYCRVA